MQHRQPAGELLLTIDVVEEFQGALVARVTLRGIVKQVQPCRKFGAAKFQLVVTLAKALTLLRRQCLVVRGSGAAIRHDYQARRSSMAINCIGVEFCGENEGAIEHAAYNVAATINNTRR